MSAKDRIYFMEENIKKIWVLLNLNYFNLKLGTEKIKLMELIKDYFKLPLIWEKLEVISTHLDKMKEVYGVDLLELVKDFKIEREDSGGAYHVITPNGPLVFPDDPSWPLK